MKYLFIFINVIFVTVIFLVWPRPVDAHILHSDGSIGAVLHIDPQDDPIAGEPAYFFFEFKDKQNKFRPENCECRASIVLTGDEIYSQPLYQNMLDPDEQNANFSFTFPQKDIYQIKVIGKPISVDAFQPFELVYDIRVSRESNSQNTLAFGGQNFIIASVIGIILICILKKLRFATYFFSIHPSNLLFRLRKLQTRVRWVYVTILY